MLADRRHRWAAVYEHRERLLRIARSRVDDVNDAEDCVQEAMLRAVEFDRLDEARLGQFLTTVTVRLCADVHRGRQRGDRLTRRLAGWCGTEPGPEDAVCDRAESAWLSGYLADLTPRQREILDARASGLSCSAVAEQLRVSYTAIESSMARVRRSLRCALESTLGIVALQPRRWAAGAGAVGAATVVATANLVTVTAPPAAPPAARAAAAPARTATMTLARNDPRPAAAGALAPADRTIPVATAPRPQVVAADPLRPPQPENTPVAGVHNAPGGDVTVTQSNETWDETAQRCLREGVQVGWVVRCGNANDEEARP